MRIAVTAQTEQGPITETYRFLDGCNEALAKTSAEQMFWHKHHMQGTVVPNDVPQH